MFRQNDKKTINAWCMYDWANSVYSLVITTTIFPIYYNAVTKSAFNSEMVKFFGIEIRNTVLYSYSLSFSFLLIALLSPLLSGIADYGDKKKSFMKFFTLLGGISCIMLFFFHGKNIEFGIRGGPFALLKQAKYLDLNNFGLLLQPLIQYTLYEIKGPFPAKLLIRAGGRLRATTSKVYSSFFAGLVFEYSLDPKP